MSSSDSNSDSKSTCSRVSVYRMPRLDPIVTNIDNVVSDITSGGASTANNVGTSTSAEVAKKSVSNSRPSKSKKGKKGRNERLNVLEEKVNRVLDILVHKKVENVNSNSCTSGGVACPEVLETDNNNNNIAGNFVPSGSTDDVISLHPDFNAERFLSDGEIDSPDDFSGPENTTKRVKRGLTSLFGDEAVSINPSTNKDKEGLGLDPTQKNVLEASYRSENPSVVTAFLEENVSLFPVDQETELLLQVPTLDPIVENLLVHKHGKRAAFSGKSGPSLFQQPFKSTEKLAFRGHQAAAMGIKTQLYIQQGLASIMEDVLNDSIDKSTLSDQLMHLITMSTRGLDQFGRCGAFFHLVRRSMAIGDTALAELDYSKKILNLPLVGGSLFGPKLESTLKDVKEKNKTLSDILPKPKKRNFPFQNSYNPPNKKFAYNNQQYQQYGNYPFRGYAQQGKYTSGNGNNTSSRGRGGQNRGRRSFTATSTTKGSEQQNKQQ